MEDTKRCLHYCGTTPVDQSFRCHDLNLHHLKTVALVEVQHLTMVIVLDEDHTHYSDAFGNIFEEDTLHKKYSQTVWTESPLAKEAQPMQ